MNQIKNIANDDKSLFCAASYSDFTIHKDEARKLRYIKDLIMKFELNPELIVQDSGPAGCYGITASYQDIKKRFNK